MDYHIARTFVDEALDCGARAGIDVGRFLADLDIHRDQLSTLNSRDFGRIWLALSQEMDDELFGLAARPMRPGSTTLLGHAVREAPTLAVAIRRALRFLRIAVDEPYGEITKEGGACVITLQETSAPRSAFAYRTFFLVLHAFTCWLAQERVPLLSVRFPCPAPEQRNDYGDFFGVPVVFNASQAQISFDARYLSRPVKRTEKDLKVFLRGAPEIFLRGYRDTSTLRHQIVTTCLSGAPSDWPDMAAAARRLRMSRSTLHRRLAQTGQSYGALKDEARKERAASLLIQTQHPITHIAGVLGYAEESAFYRAFGRWYGMTPASFREIHNAG